MFSGTVLLELARRGVSREQAYEWVQRNAMRSFAEHRDFKALLLADPDVTRALPAAEIERAFDLDEQLKHVDDIFDRVFGTTLNAESAELAETEKALCSAGSALTVVEVTMRARVFVTLKPSVFDPQGQTIADALHSLGYAGVEDVRQGK